MDRTKNRLWTLLICVLLSAATLATYWPVVHYQFINFDDLGYIIQNPHVRAGFSWQNVRWAFTSGYGSNWHPLTWLSHMLDGQLFGLNAGRHHLVNLLFHTANIVLLFLVLRRLTTAIPTSPLPSPPAEREKVARGAEEKTASSPLPSPPEERGKAGPLISATWRSAFVAGLFALHPVHVESVAWVAERKDVLSTFFFFLTIWVYSAYVESGDGPASKKSEGRIPNAEGNPNDKNPNVSALRTPHSALWYGLALFFYLLGLMSKPMLVTLPFVLLLLDFWPLGRFQFSKPNGMGHGGTRPYHPTLVLLAREKIPFFLLSVASCITTFLVQEHGGAVAELDIVPVSHRLSNAVVSYVGYMKKMVWPTDLALLYPPREAMPLWMIGGSILLLLVISLIAVALVRRAPYLAVGWFWYLGTLVPVIGLVQVGMQSMADRYTYIPFIGLFIAITWGVADFVGVRGQRSEIRGQGAESRIQYPVSSIHRILSGCLGLIILAVCATLSAKQVRFWKDTESISVHSLAVTADNPLMQSNLGSALLEQHRFEDGAEHFRAALRLHPNYAEAESNLGFALALQGKLDEAIEHYHRALELKPNIVRTHYVLGQALSMQGKRDEAIAEFRITLELNPDWPPALNDLAWFRATDPRAEIRDGTEAVALAERACQLTEYRDPLMIGTLAAAYAEAGRFEDAVRTGEKARAMAATAGKETLAERNRQLIEMYREKKAYRGE